MTELVLGLAVFLGVHGFTTLRGPRTALIGRFGEVPYKIVYSLAALLGFYLIVAGFGAYRARGMVPVWDPPAFLRHIALLLMWPSLVLLVAAYARPAGIIKTRAKHPMLLAVKIWATAHLLANGDLGTMVLSVALLAWAVYARITLKRRPGVVLAEAQGWTMGDWIALGLGTAAWAAFIGGLHRALIGVGVLG